MKRLAFTLAIAFVALSATAQSTSELFKFSQHDYSSASARVAAMGGAFTSLGADHSTMNINPAGIAMYNSSELGMSLGVNSVNITSNYGGNYLETNNDTKFTLPSLSAVIDVDDFTVGLSFNTLGSYNSTMRTFGDYEQFNSMSRIWVDQLEGIPSQNLGRNDIFGNYNPMLWDAILAYDNYLIDPATRDADYYTLIGIIDAEDAIGSSIRESTTGASFETAISGGYNVNDKFYIGATLGFQQQNLNTISIYDEEMLVDDYTIGDFRYMSLYDQTIINTVGFNIKVGAILRPIPQLRFGVAYHSPTWMSVDETSFTDMQTMFSTNSNYQNFTPDLVQTYDMQTPGKLLLGASAMVANSVILSFDYEYIDYSTMLYSTNINTFGWRTGTLSTDIDNMPNYSSSTNNRGDINLNNIIGNYYAASNSYKVGIEFTPARGLFLRAGYAFTDSPYAEVQSYYDPSTLLSDYGAITRYSAGIGYRTGSFNIDFAYINTQYSLIPAKFFDYVTSYAYDTGYGPDTAPEIVPAGVEISSFNNIYQNRNDHNFILSLSMRF